MKIDDEVLAALKALMAEFTSADGERIFETDGSGNEYPSESV